MLASEVGVLWDAYQDSRYGYVTGRLPLLRPTPRPPPTYYEGDDQDQARQPARLGATKRAAMVLTKLGETDLAWIAADRGLAAGAAQRRTRSSPAPCSARSAHCPARHRPLHRSRPASSKTPPATCEPDLEHAARRALLSVYGTLFLAGSMAAARANEDRPRPATFLAERRRRRRRLGADANHMWTAFGPTNVAIHRVATAGELGDVQVAVDLGPRVDTPACRWNAAYGTPSKSPAPTAPGTARDDAWPSSWTPNRLAPEQVRHHYISRQLVLSWIRRQRGKPVAPSSSAWPGGSTCWPEPRPSRLRLVTANEIATHGNPAHRRRRPLLRRRRPCPARHSPATRDTGTSPAATSNPASLPRPRASARSKKKPASHPRSARYWSWTGRPPNTRATRSSSSSTADHSAPSKSAKSASATVNSPNGAM